MRGLVLASTPAVGSAGPGGNHWGRAVRDHRHRDPSGTSPLTAARRHHQAPASAGRSVGSALRPVASRDQSPDPRPHPHWQGGPHPPRQRTGRGPRTARRPHPPSRRHPTRPRRHRRSRRLTLAVSRRATGRPISAYRLAERLRELGIQSGQSRPTALFQLATVRMLGIHITVAVAWQRATSRDWTSYAADVSRRGQTHEAR